MYNTALDHRLILIWTRVSYCSGPLHPVDAPVARGDCRVRSWGHSRISIVARSAVCALGNDRATCSRAAGALPRRRSQRLSASFATSAPSSCRRGNASTMVRSGEYRPMLSSMSSRRCSVRPTSNVARSNECQRIGWNLVVRARSPRGKAMSVSRGISSVRSCSDSALSRQIVVADNLRRLRLLGHCGRTVTRRLPTRTAQRTAALTGPGPALLTLAA